MSEEKNTNSLYDLHIETLKKLYRSLITTSDLAVTDAASSAIQRLNSSYPKENV